jgi:hypothetical protein
VDYFQQQQHPTMKLSCSFVIAAAVFLVAAFSCHVVAERGVSLDTVRDDMDVLDDLPDACDWNNSDEPGWAHWKKDDKKV